MTVFRTLITSTAILAGTAAAADVTAQQVWDNWKGQMEVYGQGFTTSGEAMEGDTLVVSDVTIEMQDNDAAVLAELGDIELTENGDGTVSVSTEDSYPITVTVTPPNDDPSTINMTMSQTNMDITVSGDPEAMIYDISAEVYALSIDSLGGRVAEQAELGEAMFALRDLAGKYSVREEELTHIAYELSAGALDLDFAFTETGEDGAFSVNGELADLSTFANLVLPQGMDLEAEQPPFNDGLAVDGGYTFGDARYDFSFRADGEAGSGAATVDGGTLAFAMDKDGLSYTGEAQNVEVSVEMPSQVPFPFEASLAAYGFDLQMPLSQGDGEPRDARLAFNLTDLQVSEILWNLGDPQQVLPRDPVSIALAVDAQVTPFFDFLDPEQQQAAVMAEVPGELNGVQVTELEIKAAGAEITGDGAFTFDNEDLTTFNGVPRPEGKMSFEINGINSLIDKLVQMGLIPEEEAMMPRMMMGMFTTPAGDDKLTSTIEVNEQGHVLANGQRLR
ncbi:DUF2125 domain-containing protein [Thalassorhabdomicrobium marinisediminis]|uniref:DUF2125 domain-containing protein n=1 Tax=Thalassorhabdomicrobium marinisediminis TaxID=2170577 RepID=UPI0024918D08|nr:DUF2125 domain-containing protein [Thalassorhabdomicrobium marinisediminis]